MLPKQLAEKVVVWGWLVAVAALPGCQRGADGVHAELSARQSSWRRALDDVKARIDALRHRAPASLAVAAPAALRVQVALDGAAQSASDVDRQMTQVAASVDAAAARGADAGERALEQATALMTDYLHGLAADVEAAGRQLDEFENNGRAPAPINGSLAAAR